jgi:hypothetical protein
MKTPCNNCICIPVCRNKDFKILIGDCIIIRKFIYTRDIDDKERGMYINTSPLFRNRIIDIFNTINPTVWDYKLKYDTELKRHILSLILKGKQFNVEVIPIIKRKRKLKHKWILK